MSGILAVIAGLGLSSAAGFRVFIPLFVLSLAAHSNAIELNESFQWLHSWPAMIALGTASVVEVASYYIPWVDNMLDTIATPAALIAGTLITASVMPEMDPAMKWVLSTIVGGGAAGVVQTGTVLTRGTSTATTGGLANPVVSTVESGSAITLSVLAIVIPVLVGIAALVLVFSLGRRLYHHFRNRRTRGPGQAVA